jgi:hypothetical protein
VSWRSRSGRFLVWSLSGVDGSAAMNLRGSRPPLTSFPRSNAGSWLGTTTVRSLGNRRGGSQARNARAAPIPELAIHPAPKVGAQASSPGRQRATPTGPNGSRRHSRPHSGPSSTGRPNPQRNHWVPARAAVAGSRARSGGQTVRVPTGTRHEECHERERDKDVFEHEHTFRLGKLQAPRCWA